jgi:hypothetical protein
MSWLTTEKRQHLLAFSFLILISCLDSVRLYAQAPRAQLFGGYTFAIFQRTPDFPVHISNGWGTSVAITPSIRLQELSLVLEGDGGYASFTGNTVRKYNILGGVRLTPMVVGGWWQKLLFMHALIGIENVSRTATFHNAFAWDVGAGVDFPISRRAGWRAIQADYRQASPTSNLRSEVRFTTGLTLSFGRFNAIE